MATILDLQDRGLRYGVIVDAAATPATLASIERAGLRYKVEVAAGITTADRAALDRRGLQYFVPVSATVSMADRAILERQGLRYAVPVDAAILPTDLAVLERQGLSYFVEVDSSGNAIATAAGGGLLLVDETNGFATDFTHAVDAERVAVKTAGATTYSTVDGFYANAGTSPKMVYDVSGVLGWSPHNLVRESKDASVNLSVSGATVTTNVTAGPLGDVTADQIALDGGNDDYFYKDQTGFALVGVTYCGAVWLKAAAPVQIGIRVNNGDGSGSTVAVVNVTTAWQQFYVSCVSGSTSPINFGLDTRSFVSGDDGLAKTVIAADWQINYGTVPTAYLPTTSAARVGLALDYDPVTHVAKGLLCEPAATNLHINSSDFSLLNVSGGTTTLNNQSGPDGALTADTFTEDTAGGVVHGAYGNATVTGNIDHTVSRYYKLGTRRYVTLGWSDGTNGAYAVYDLQSGVVGSSAAIAAGVLNSASMQAIGNGWYRCILSAKVNATSVYWTFGGATAATITPDPFGRQLYTGTSSTLILGHVQIETGTVATSPIPTLAASVTRAADVVRITPASINHSAVAGSWRLEVSMNNMIGNSQVLGYQNHGGDTPIFQNALTSWGFYDSIAFFTKTVASTLGAHKVACAFANNDQALTADGLAPATSAAVSIALGSPGTHIGFGHSPVAAGAAWINGYISKVVYVPRRKSNAELQAETVP